MTSYLERGISNIERERRDPFRMPKVEDFPEYHPPPKDQTMNETTGSLQFTEAERRVIREQNDRLTDDESDAFLSAAVRYGLNPLANQIYSQVRGQGDKRRVTFVTGIDGYRLIADRTNKYGGNDDPVFDHEDCPRKATVTVYKMLGEQARPFTASARWDQYYPGEKLGFMWNRMPHLMLGKCAEALALRKPFPAELSGIYTAEEMEQADKVPPKASPLGDPPPAERPNLPGNEPLPIAAKGCPDCSAAMELHEQRNAWQCTECKYAAPKSQFKVKEVVDVKA